MTIENDIKHLKTYREIPNGSLIVWHYLPKSSPGGNYEGAVRMVQSAERVQKKTSEGYVDGWNYNSLTNYLNGTSGVVLARMLESGQWQDYPDRVEFIQKQLEKKEVKK